MRGERIADCGLRIADCRLGSMVRWLLSVSLLMGLLAGKSQAESTEFTRVEDGKTSQVLKGDKSFFERLDPANPALTRMRALIRHKDYTGARDALSEHFRQRRVRPGFWPLDTRSIQNPDDLVNHVFSFYGSPKFDAGHPIRWNDTFLDDRELTYALNRHQHLSVLAAAYRQTRDPKYVRAFVEQVRDWIARNPPSEGLAWAAWRNLEVATRLGVWCDVFFQFLPAPEFSADDQLVMLQSLHEQAAWLAPQVGPGEGDWAVAIATGLATVGVIFPEFKQSGEWRTQAYAALVGNFRRQIYADGSQLALSPYHHNTTLSTFWLPFKLAIENHLPVPDVYRQMLERMCAYQTYLRRPDGRYPAFNACEPADCRPLLVVAANFFDRPDFAYILTYGQTGAAPTSASCAFRDSGVFIMRDNWTSAANYLALDAGPYGTSYQHEDKLGFELAAYGQTVLVDPGRYTLDTGEPLTRYLSGTSAHNTVTIDDSGQRRGQVAESWIPSGRSPNVWISRPDFDYFAGGYLEGYGSAPDARHLRRVFFVKNKQRPYWVISDRIEGGESHRLTARWQFIPGEIEHRGGLTCVTKLPRGNLAICPPVETARSWSARVLTGSRDPMGGWVSFAYSKIEPAPQLCYDFRTSLPATMEYVLVPFAGEAQPPQVHVMVTSATATADFTSLALDFGDGRDVVFIAHDLKKAARQIAGCQTKGCFVAVRSIKSDKPAVLIDAE